MEDQELAKINVEIPGTSSLPQVEKTSLKSEKKSQASRISSYTKRKKNSVKSRAQDSNLGPLVYEASVLKSVQSALSDLKRPPER